MFIEKVERERKLHIDVPYPRGLFNSEEQFMFMYSTQVLFILGLNLNLEMCNNFSSSHYLLCYVCVVSGHRGESGNERFYKFAL